MIVVDASLTIAWLLREPQLMVAPNVYKSLTRHSIAVPSHWAVEIASALWVNVRRGRVRLDLFDSIMEELSVLEIAADAPISINEIGVLTRFALAQKLTVYDAAYVQLAARLGVPLATVDEDMRSAARRLEIPLLPA